MSNALEDALNRASAEQKERNQQIIEEARQNIKLVSMRQMEDIAPSDADLIARNAQVIEDAKQTIPYETMKDVDEIGPPLNTPAITGNYKSNVVDLHPNVQSTIETIEQGEGNNYLRENAVDRALARPPQETPQWEQQQAIER